MAGETSNTAEMARTLATELLGIFGWKKVGSKEQNWDCVTPEHKNEKDKEKKTHSTDNVFSYDDPYEPKRVYLNTDLKSYAAGTIKKGMLKKELRSLAQTTECACKSEQWQKLYQSEEHNSKILGLLFIYNHDGNFDESFTDFFDSVRASSIKLQSPHKVVVFGPKLITYLASVANDILTTSARQKFDLKDCGFYYPELIRSRTRSDQLNAATIEMLTGPWQILRHPPFENQRLGGYLIYYNGSGATTDEFKYLIDYIFRYQLLRELGTIEIRTVGASNDAASNFAKAKAAYAEDFYGFEDFGRKEFEHRIERISFRSVPMIMPTFSTIEIGMK
jgi:hypothetical protein